MAVEVTLVEHPLVADSLARIRDRDTPNPLFRTNLERIGTLLLAEATKSLPTVEGTVETPITTAVVQRLAVQPVIVPVLRAGLGMVEGVLRLIPSARVGHVGMSRDEESLLPLEYYFKVPAGSEARRFVVVDPMLATGGSAVAAIAGLKSRGAERISFMCLVAAPEGAAALHAAHPDVPIFTAALDRQLNAVGYILPGLGDAGDRLFGTK